MTTTLQPLDRTQEESPSDYLWVHHANGLECHTSSSWQFKNHEDIINIYEATEEHYKYANYYTKEVVNGTLLLSEDETHSKQLDERTSGEIYNLWYVAKSLKHKSDRHLITEVNAQGVIPEDEDFWLFDTLTFMKADIIKTIQGCMSNGAKGKLNENIGATLNLFHSIARSYESVVRKEAESWAQFSYQTYKDGATFNQYGKLDNFHKAVKEQCMNLVSIDETITMPQFINNVVFAVLGTNDHPSVAPKLSVATESDDITPNTCIAVLDSENVKDISYQWYVNGSAIEGAEYASFDYTGNSGDLSVVVSAKNYIGEDLVATSDVIKIS